MNLLHVRTRFSVAGTFQILHRRSLNKSREMFQQAFRPAMEASTSAFFLSPSYPMDERKCSRLIFPLRQRIPLIQVHSDSIHLYENRSEHRANRWTYNVQVL